MSSLPGETLPPTGSDLEHEAQDVGRALSTAFGALVDALPEGRDGPQKLGRRLGVDKVLASRLLKAMRQREDLAVVYHAPGPEPLRRVVAGAAGAGVSAGLVVASESALARFEDLIRRRAGDRATLNTILTGWLPGERASFELSRKQQAFRGMSDLMGVVTDVSFSAALLHPSATPDRLDLVWIIGRQGLRRLRPDVSVKFFTRRMSNEPTPRRPTNLLGHEVNGPDRGGLEQFLPAPVPIEVRQVGEAVHYTLGETGFGPRSGVDVLFAEVNRAELPARVPRGSGRRAHYFVINDTPTRSLSFDVHLHEDVYPGTEPELLVHHVASGQGAVDINDPAREFDRVEVSESLNALGVGPSRARSADVPGLAEVLRHVYETLGWDGERFRGYRTRIAFPIHATQVTIAFRPPEL